MKELSKEPSEESLGAEKRICHMQNLGSAGLLVRASLHPDSPCAVANPFGYERLSPVVGTLGMDDVGMGWHAPSRDPGGRCCDPVIPHSGGAPGRGVYRWRRTLCYG
mmetsp:Transcript_85164/g.141981  ORF Transcript_85164/g.141981 Transcript_85164/m.141981 type:complete len:107 (-) Transcript_85164:21-341(-)